MEWYDPEAITTESGSLVITLSQKETHNLHYEGGELIMCLRSLQFKKNWDSLSSTLKDFCQHGTSLFLRHWW